MGWHGYVQDERRCRACKKRSVFLSVGMFLPESNSNIIAWRTELVSGELGREKHLPQKNQPAVLCILDLWDEMKPVLRTGLVSTGL